MKRFHGGRQIRRTVCRAAGVPGFPWKCLRLGAVTALLLAASQLALWADDPTSRYISLSPIATSLPAGNSGNAVQFEVWNQANGGIQISTEGHTVDTDGGSNITNDTGFADLLLGRPGGLNPANYPSGESRYLDVTQSGVSVLTGRVPLYASAFTISPGPQGPPGPTGPQGPQGPPGPVASVTAGDASIAIAGTTSNPSVAVAPNGITNSSIANGALSPAKVSGTAATLGANTFSANQTIAGNGVSVALGNVGCGPPTMGIGPAPVSCNNFTLGYDASQQSTFINRPAGGAIYFRENNGATQAAILPGGNLQVTGNGANVVLGNVGCGPPTMGIGPAPVSCSTFSLGYDDSQKSIFLNRPGGGSIVFRESNGSDQMRITPGGRVGVNTSSPAARLHAVSPLAGGGAIEVGIRGEGTVGVRGVDTTGFGGGIGVEGDGGGLGFSVGGLFTNTFGADILIGQSSGAKVFRVDGTGKVFANGGYQTGGADFAESVDVDGSRLQYEPGDLLAIDPASDRRLVRAAEAYSTTVAGIYSTKPGLLGTPYDMGDPRIANGVPLAVVGIVPCKVTAENGAIQRGDLLVSSSTEGYAMKGTDRSRMLGAVVGKALEPLPSGEGIIQVLVTLQ